MVAVTFTTRLWLRSFKPSTVPDRGIRKADCQLFMVREQVQGVSSLKSESVQKMTWERALLSPGHCTSLSARSNWGVTDTRQSRSRSTGSQQSRGGRKEATSMYSLMPPSNTVSVVVSSCKAEIQLESQQTNSGNTILEIQHWRCSYGYSIGDATLERQHWTYSLR